MFWFVALWTIFCNTKVIRQKASCLKLIPNLLSTSTLETDLELSDFGIETQCVTDSHIVSSLSAKRQAKFKIFFPTSILNIKWQWSTIRPFPPKKIWFKNYENFLWVTEFPRGKKNESFEMDRKISTSIKMRKKLITAIL